MKYDFIIEQSLKTISLKRVRIKVDPKLVNTEADLSECDGYEGYILAECGAIPKVLVMSPDFDGGMSVMNIPDEHLEVMTGDEDTYILNQLKVFILQQYSLDIDSPEAQSVITADSIESIESALKTIGHNDDDVKVLYRKFILDEDVNIFNEISFGGILKGAARLAKGAVTTAGKAALTTADILTTSDPNAALNKARSAAAGVVQNANRSIDNFRKPTNKKIDKQNITNIKTLQNNKVIPAVNDTITILNNNIVNGDEEFKIQDIEVDRNVASIIAVPQNKNLQFDSIEANFYLIKSANDIINVYFMKDGRRLSGVRPFSAAVQHKDLKPVFGSKLNWELTSLGNVKNIKQEDPAKQIVTPDTTSTTAAVPVSKKTTHTKAGIPVKPPTAADASAMHLPTHPLTSKTAPNIRRESSTLNVIGKYQPKK